MKVVINRCWGGFGLSLRGQKRLAELQGKEIYFYKQPDYQDKQYKNITDLDCKDIFITTTIKDLGEIISNEEELNKYIFCKYGIIELKRNDRNLIKVVEELGNTANGICAKLKIVEIPDNVKWEITNDNCTGWEVIQELHRSWT